MFDFFVILGVQILCHHPGFRAVSVPNTYNSRLREWKEIHRKKSKMAAPNRVSDDYNNNLRLNQVYFLY
jgi:hypothetical protein